MISIARKYKKRDGTRIDLTLNLVHLTNTEKNRNKFNLTKLWQLLIKVEYQDTKTSIPECRG